MLKLVLKNIIVVALFVCSAFAVSSATVAQVSAVQTPDGIPKARIAVVGGTFLNDIMFSSELIKKEFTIKTKLGTSPKIYYAEFEGTPFY